MRCHLGFPILILRHGRFGSEWREPRASRPGDDHRLSSRHSTGGPQLIQLPRILGWFVYFTLGSVIWTVVIGLAVVVARFALVGFFAWQIFYTTDRFFHLWLPFTPTAIFGDVDRSRPVGRWLLGIPLAIIGWWICLFLVPAHGSSQTARPWL